jgi:NADPH2:quinone reductase
VKYVAYARAGGPDVLYVAQGAQPIPNAGEVLIEVEAAGVCRADALARSGRYPPPIGASPVLGLEVSGSVAQVGRGTVGFAVGDAVVALCNGGGYSEYVCVPVGQVLPLPENWSFVEGAALPENAFTVYDNLLVRCRLRDGEIVLVHGGSSGIGTTAIGFALAVGARVIATAGSERKCEAVVELGAEAAINYRARDFVEAVNEYTHGRGVDVVLDIVGGSYLDRDLRCLAGDGRIACIATTDGSTSSLDLGQLLARRATICGSSLRPRTVAQKAQIAAGLRRDIWPLLPQRNPIVPTIDSAFSFDDAAAAHARLESSEHIGKIVLVPQGRP